MTLRSSLRNQATSGDLAIQEFGCAHRGDPESPGGTCRMEQAGSILGGRPLSHPGPLSALQGRWLEGPLQDKEGAGVLGPQGLKPPGLGSGHQHRYERRKNIQPDWAEGEINRNKENLGQAF